MVKRLWEWAIVQAESMAETGIVTGLLAAPLLGVVTEEDADSAVVDRHGPQHPGQSRTRTDGAGAAGPATGRRVAGCRRVSRSRRVGRVAPSG